MAYVKEIFCRDGKAAGQGDQRSSHQGNIAESGILL